MLFLSRSLGDVVPEGRAVVRRPDHHHLAGCFDRGRCRRAAWRGVLRRRLGHRPRRHRVRRVLARGRRPEPDARHRSRGRAIGLASGDRWLGLVADVHGQWPSDRHGRLDAARTHAHLPLRTRHQCRPGVGRAAVHADRRAGREHGMHGPHAAPTDPRRGRHHDRRQRARYLGVRGGRLTGHRQRLAVRARDTDRAPAPRGRDGTRGRLLSRDGHARIRARWHGLPRAAGSEPIGRREHRRGRPERPGPCRLAGRAQSRGQRGLVGHRRR